MTSVTLIYEVGILWSGIGIFLIGLAAITFVCCGSRKIEVVVEHTKIPDIKFKHMHGYNIDYDQWKHLESVFKKRTVEVV